MQLISRDAAPSPSDRQQWCRGNSACFFQIQRQGTASQTFYGKLDTKPEDIRKEIVVSTSNTVLLPQVQTQTHSGFVIQRWLELQGLACHHSQEKMLLFGGGFSFRLEEGIETGFSTTGETAKLLYTWSAPYCTSFLAMFKKNVVPASAFYACPLFKIARNLIPLICVRHTLRKSTNQAPQEI